MEGKKSVIFPVRVPSNDFCWDGKNACSQFDNYGGFGSCSLKIGSPKRREDFGDYLKPVACFDLKDNHE